MMPVRVAENLKLRAEAQAGQRAAVLQLPAAAPGPDPDAHSGRGDFSRWGGFAKLNAISFALTLAAVVFVIASLLTITVVPKLLSFSRPPRHQSNRQLRTAGSSGGRKLDDRGGLSFRPEP